MEAEMEEYVFEKEIGDPFGIDSFVTRSENDPVAHAPPTMVLFFLFLFLFLPLLFAFMLMAVAVPYKPGCAISAADTSSV